MGAIVGTYPHNGEAAKLMAEKLPHRGDPVRPTVELPQCNALHHRDVESGMRLMENEELTVALDGRILNSAELAVELDISGVGDAAVVAELISQKGPQALDTVKGGFTVAFHTPEGVVIARDILGLQPLFYGFAGDQFLYASEAKALEPLVEEVFPVQPGHLVNQKGEETRFDSVVRPVEVPETPEEAASALRRLTERAVERRLDGSGEAHAFLSGGLDSSIVAVLLADRVDRLYTYTVGVEEAGDVKYSRKMVEFLDSEHTEYLFSEDDLVNILPNVIYHFESFTQDFMQAGMGTYLVSRLTAQSGSNYVFCGEGPDEVFGGYDDIKAVASDEELFRSVCVRITEELHEGGGTRLERMTAAQGLEYAVPFLDKSIVRFGLQLPVEWRVHPEEGIEKWIVRKAFEDLLPDEIVWRGKAPFARGAGALDTAVRVGERLGVTVPEAAGNDNPKFPLTKLDQLYYSVFQRFYNPAKMRRLFARWDPFRERF